MRTVGTISTSIYATENIANKYSCKQNVKNQNNHVLFIDQLNNGKVKYNLYKTILQRIGSHKKEAIYKQKSCKIINVYKTICSNDNWHEDTAISNRSGCPPENSIKNIETPQEKDDETKQVRLIKENLEKWKNTLNQYQYRAEFSPWKATQWSKQN